ncbi:probable cytochrome c oxidase subunit 4, mitochondrial [Coccomyxa sp. Obi]|nr:probable cytochrome c oxidase subunit 4, mitochondrial [Coccomyxa sp. Obi]
MSRLGRLPWRLATRALCSPCPGPVTVSAQPPLFSRLASETQHTEFRNCWHKDLHTTGLTFASGDVTLDLEHATGLERAELEGQLQNKDIFHEDWLDAPFGTEDKPVEVTSSFSERIVGVPDPYDDSIIWWGCIEEGQPPKQLVEGGEFFVLKRIGGGDSHGH